MEQNNKELLLSGLIKLEVPDAEQKADILAMYCDRVLEANGRFNLLGNVTEYDMVVKHILDSVSGYKLVGTGKKVLDIGTGSGILSIAALLLGAESAFGVDIDPLSVKTARENGIKNGYKEPQLTFVNGDLADKVSGKYDIVIANIVADVIIRLCDNVTDFVKEGGVFITSGIIDTRADEVIEAITAAGFSIAARYDDGGWVSLAAILN